jgi:membrane-bound lytic murein transglycosylase D
MKRSLFLCTALVGATACAAGLPPAPTATPVAAAVQDSLVPVVDLSALSNEAAAADAVVLNDLAAAVPDAAVIPAFDAQRVRWDIDVRTFAGHPRVQYYLSYFGSQARSRMEVFLARGVRYEPMIRRRFEAEGLPGDLGYLALIESGYSSDAVSRSYAVGMWQFMRGTGRGYGLRVDSWVDERRDPVKATDAAARHLRDLRERFGSLYLAAAAYNAGAGKVSRSLGKLAWDAPVDADSVTADSAMADSSMAEAGDTLGEEEDSTLAETDSTGEQLDAAIDTNDVTSDAAFFRLASTDLLAAETQDYVPKLIAAALIAKEPGRYGLTAAAGTPFAYDSLVVTDATGLDVIARLAETSVAEIHELNPQYLRLATPPHSRMVIRLPVGSGPTVTARYAALPAKARVHFLSYVVPRRQRLTSVAARYYLPASEIRSANPRLHSSWAAKGTRLVIPAVAVPSRLAMLATGTVGSSRAHRAGRLALHRVRRGETLTGIARRYRVSVQAIRRANALSRSYSLRAGMRLRIPG